MDMKMIDITGNKRGHAPMKAFACSTLVYSLSVGSIVVWQVCSAEKFHCNCGLCLSANSLHTRYALSTCQNK
jgi:hypothetical protein